MNGSKLNKPDEAPRVDVDRGQLQNMLEIEANLSRQHLHNFQKFVFPHCRRSLKWREKVTKWCYDLVDYLELKRSLVYVTMLILDRYCVLNFDMNDLDQRNFEIASLSAFYLAVRVAGVSGLSLDDIVSLSRAKILRQEITAMGKLMVKGLEWKCRIITPFDLLTVCFRFLSLNIDHTEKKVLYDEAIYLIELSVSDVQLTHILPSEMAIAALLGAALRKIPSVANDCIVFAKDYVGVDTDSSRIRIILGRLASMRNANEGEACEAQTHLIYPDADLSEHNDDLACSSNRFHDVSSLSHAISSEEFELPGHAAGPSLKRKLDNAPPGFKIGKFL